MKHRNIVLVSVLSVIVLAVLALYLSAWSPVALAGMVINTFRSAHSPHGTLVVEPHEVATPSDAGSWSSYNRTLTSERYSPLSQINTQNVRGLRVLCSYNTHLHENFNSSPIMVDGVFIGNALGDLKGVRGRMYALAADSGRIVWETYLVPKAPGDPIRGPQGRMPV